MKGFCNWLLVGLAAVVGYTVLTRKLEKSKDFR